MWHLPAGTNHDAAGMADGADTASINELVSQLVLQTDANIPGIL